MDRTQRTVSRDVTWRPRSAASVRSMIASCDRTTPLLVPVVPELNRIKAGLTRKYSDLGRSRDRPLDDD